MELARTFLASEYEPQPLERARYAILPVPLEKSVSYGKGTSKGPIAILDASNQLEAWELGREPAKKGICTLAPIDCNADIERVLERIEHSVDTILLHNSVPIILGGEHTASLGALRSFAKNGSLPGLLQIDAHADLRESYEGSPYSHACVMYRAVNDLGYRLAQFGIREFSREEVACQRKYNVISHDAVSLADNGLPSPLLTDDFPEKIYVTVDVDGLDSSLMPATGTPSPGGFFWHDLRRLLTELARTRAIVGFDVVELAPAEGLSCCNFLAAKLVHMLMALVEMSHEHE